MSQTDYDEKKHVISDNTKRRQMSDPEKVRASRELEIIEKEESKRLQREGGQNYGKSHPKVVSQKTQPISKEKRNPPTIDRVAKAMRLLILKTFILPLGDTKL